MSQFEITNELCGNMSDKKRSLLEYKEKLVSEIKWLDYEIDAGLSYIRNRKEEDFNSDSDHEDMEPKPPLASADPLNDMIRADWKKVHTCLQATQELTGVQLLQSEVNFLSEPPQITQNHKEDDVEEGQWREVTAECKVDLIPFSINFYIHQPYRRCAAPSFHNVCVNIIKKSQEKELAMSILGEAVTPSDAVQVLRSYGKAHRSRRDTLAKLAEKFQEGELFMEALPEGGYILRCADMLELSWWLNNKWSPVAPFYHRMKFDLEYMDEHYIKDIKQVHRQLQNPAVETDERTYLLAKIINICIASKKDSNTNESLDESEEARPSNRRTTMEHEQIDHHDMIPDRKRKRDKDSEVMAPPQSVPKKSKSKSSPQKRPNAIVEKNVVKKKMKNDNEAKSLNVINTKDQVRRKDHNNDAVRKEKNNNLPASEGKIVGSVANKVKNVASDKGNDVPVAANKKKEVKKIAINEKNNVPVVANKVKTVASDKGNDVPVAINKNKGKQIATNEENNVQVVANKEKDVASDKGNDVPVAINKKKGKQIATNEENNVPVVANKEKDVASDKGNDVPVAINKKKGKQIATNEENNVPVVANKEKDVASDKGNDVPVAINKKKGKQIATNEENNVPVVANKEKDKMVVHDNNIAGSKVKVNKIQSDKHVGKSKEKVHKDKNDVDHNNKNGGKKLATVMEKDKNKATAIAHNVPVNEKLLGKNKNAVANKDKEKNAEKHKVKSDLAKELNVGAPKGKEKNIVKDSTAAPQSIDEVDAPPSIIKKQTNVAKSMKSKESSQNLNLVNNVKKTDSEPRKENQATGKMVALKQGIKRLNDSIKENEIKDEASRVTHKMHQKHQKLDTVPKNMEAHKTKIPIAYKNKPANLKLKDAGVKSKNIMNGVANKNNKLVMEPKNKTEAKTNTNQMAKVIKGKDNKNRNGTMKAVMHKDPNKFITGKVLRTPQKKITSKLNNIRMPVRASPRGTTQKEEVRRTPLKAMFSTFIRLK